MHDDDLIIRLVPVLGKSKQVQTPATPSSGAATPVYAGAHGGDPPELRLRWASAAHTFGRIFFARSSQESNVEGDFLNFN